MRVIITGLFFLMSVGLLGQEHFVFSPINSGQGLSDNGIRCIGQLPDGRMVFITQGLINIYDGSGFRYLHYNDKQGYTLANYSGFHRAYVDNEHHLWLKNQHRLFVFDLLTERFISNADSVFQTQHLIEPLQDFFMDADRNFWYLNAKDDLLFRKSGEDVFNIFATNVSISGGTKDVLFDLAVIEQEVFLFYKSGIIICYDLNTHQEKYREDSSVHSEYLYQNTLMVVPYKNYLYQVRNGNNGGLMLRFNVNDRAWDRVFETAYWQNTLTIDIAGNCWLSSYIGIWLIDSGLQHKQFVSPLQLVDGKVFETEISTQYNDNNGGLWIGSVDRGLLYYHPDRFKFRNFGRAFFKLNENESLRVNCVAELNGTVYLGTQSGLYEYEKGDVQIKKSIHLPADIECLHILIDSNNKIWIGSQNKGLYCISNGHVKHFDLPFEVRYLFESESGSIYLSNYYTFGILNAESGEFKQIDAPFGYVSQLEQYDKHVLLGASGSGVLFYDEISQKFDAKNAEKLLEHSNHVVNCLYTDSRGFNWFGTLDGLCVYNASTGMYKSFYEEDGLVNNSIRSIIEDESGKVWVATSNGISSIVVDQRDGDYHFTFSNFNRYDGVIEDDFIHGSVVRTSDNRLIWGGIDGFNEIDLLKIDDRKQELNTPLFTHFYVAGNAIKVGESYNGHVILEQSLSATKAIHLKHNQNFIGFDFSALNYVNPSQTYYRYQLEGVDADWNEIRPSNGVGSINYTNLAPGTYKLKVKAANNSQVWGTDFAVIDINIDPPFWKTLFAYFLYITLIVGTGSVIIYFYVKRSREVMLIQQKEELDQMKLAFYTNISHELKTPLSLIITPLDSIIKKYQNEAIAESLNGINRNAKNLLKLINQLLDYRRMEMNGESLQLSYCQLNEFVGGIVSSFQDIANEKSIQLQFEYSDDDITGSVDKDKIQKIVNNLLSNALKFTGSGGKVTLKLSRKHANDEQNAAMEIEVSDSGCGIPEKDLPYVFNRFYQVRQTKLAEGNGIGLHLVKHYTDLHGGKVVVESKVDVGSKFTVVIPGYFAIEADDKLEQSNDGVAKKVSVLVVEDNQEFREFMVNELKEHYNVLQAEDGRKGLSLARSKQPDLIITDVMMPEMSGTEMCFEIKNDIHVSHIPVIILTAKSSEQAQVEGFKARADAYVTKPFNMDILLLRIQNLLDQQEQRKQLFRKNVEIAPSDVAVTDIDEKLIQKAIQHIEENINNSSYSVEQLSKDMFMDRTNLYRKLLAIAGLTPSEFIRTIRLKRAAQLLEKGLSVAEVSDQVGFGTTSYFSKCFQEEFGVKPSQYKNR